MAVPHHASHIVLRSYYAHVCPLREYLSLTTLENDLRFIDEDARLAELVASVTVASNVPWDQCPKHRLEAPEISMAQVPASHTGLIDSQLIAVGRSSRSCKSAFSVVGLPRIS